MPASATYSNRMALPSVIESPPASPLRLSSTWATPGRPAALGGVRQVTTRPRSMPAATLALTRLALAGTLPAPTKPILLRSATGTKVYEPPPVLLGIAALERVEQQERESLALFANVQRQLDEAGYSHSERVAKERANMKQKAAVREEAAAKQKASASEQKASASEQAAGKQKAAASEPTPEEFEEIIRQATRGIVSRAHKRL